MSEIPEPTNPLDPEAAARDAWLHQEDTTPTEPPTAPTASVLGNLLQDGRAHPRIAVAALGLALLMVAAMCWGGSAVIGSTSANPSANTSLPASTPTSVATDTPSTAPLVPVVQATPYLTDTPAPPTPTPTPDPRVQAALDAINNENAANLAIPVPLSGTVTVDPIAADGSYTIHDTLGDNLGTLAAFGLDPAHIAGVIENEAYDCFRALYHDTTIRPKTLTIIINEFSGRQVGQVTTDAFTAGRWDWTKLWWAGTWYFSMVADNASLDPSLPEPTLGGNDYGWFLHPGF